MVTSADLQKIARVEHADPHRVLGPHARENALFIRVFRPDAVEVRILPDSGHAPRVASRIHPAGVFEAVFTGVTEPFPYRVEARYEGGTFVFRDPYAFRPGLGELDEHLFAEGTHEQIYRHLGAHVREVDGVRGTAFAVWAPFAARVSVAGDFNGWDGRLHPMRRDKAGVWELFVPDVVAGALYKFEIRTPRGLVFMKADPFGRAMELRPNNASKVHERRYAFNDDAWIEARAQAAPHRRPLSIYEVHLGSWRRRHRPGEAQPDAGAAGWLTYRELAKELLDYVVEMGFTHVELLPLMEHPYDGSWGYQVAGYYAPTARWGDPDDLRYFVDQAHARGIGVLLDWVPAHFPKDAWALGRFDGTALFEHLDPRQGEHTHWNTFIFNYGRNEVRNFLVANALYWLDEFHVDGLRVDAVASMLYLDYGKEHGGWVANKYGGRENLEAIAFMRELNERVHARFPGAIVCAEESTAWPGVTRPTYLGGLGFDFKWNMGWMHDTLEYFSMDSIFRSFHHNLVTFGLMYAFSENFLLPLSHDEVVHLKRSLLSKMPGDVWRMRANLRALYGYMWAHPGKKLLFMGGEIGQWTEWNEATELQWGLLGEEGHRGIQRLVRDLNAVYRAHAALWEVDDSWDGFQWIDANDATQSVVTFVRYAMDAKPRPPGPPPGNEEPPESKALRLALEEAEAATARSPEDGGEEVAPAGEGTARSGEGTARSGEGTARSGEGTALSGEAISRGGEGTALSGEGISRSGEGTALSGEGISRSGEGTALSGEGISRGGEGTALPGEGISRGGEGSAASAEAPAASAEAPSTAPEAGPPVARASAPAPRDPTVAGPHVVFIGNFTPVPRYNYRVGVPCPGRYRELLNTDAREYGGSGMGNLGVVDVHPVPAHGFAQSVVLTLPPLSVLYLVPEPAAAALAPPVAAAAE